LPCGFFLSFFVYSSPNLSGCRLDVYHTSTVHTWCGPSANLECRSEMCCMRLAGNTGCKNDAKNRHLRTITQLRRAISSQLWHVSTIGKNLLSSNISHTCPYNMVNFGPLAAEIVSLVWSTPANFNGFRVLAALLHSQTAALFSCEDKVVRWCADGDFLEIFCVLHFQRAMCSTFQTCILNSH